MDGISFDHGEGRNFGFSGPERRRQDNDDSDADRHSDLYIGVDLLFWQGFFKISSKRSCSGLSFASTYVSLPWLLTIEQNLNVSGRLAGLPGKEIAKRADPLLERFGILDKKKHPVSALSSGQITRLMLVKAFLSSPDVVLLDEPTASLDPEMAQDVLSFLREERKKGAFPFCLHRTGWMK